MVKACSQETIFKNVSGNRLSWWGRIGGFKAEENQRANSRPDHRCFNTEYHMEMRKSRKINCPAPLQTAQDFWQTRLLNPRYHAESELRQRKER